MRFGAAWPSMWSARRVGIFRVDPMDRLLKGSVSAPEKRGSFSKSGKMPHPREGRSAMTKKGILALSLTIVCVSPAMGAPNQHTVVDEESGEPLSGVYVLTH